jgi:hypothetical protein
MLVKSVRVLDKLLVYELFLRSLLAEYHVTHWYMFSSKYLYQLA